MPIQTLGQYDLRPGHRPVRSALTQNHPDDRPTDSHVDSREERVDQRDRQILDIGHRVHPEVDRHGEQQAEECGRLSPGCGIPHTFPAEHQCEQCGRDERGENEPEPVRVDS